MRMRRLFTFAVCFSLAVVGCTSATPRSETSPPISTSRPIVSPTPTPVRQLTITLDGLLYTRDGATDLIPLSDGQGLLALFQTVTGVMPPGIDVEGYFEGYDPGMTSYEWREVKVAVSDDDGRSTIAVLAPAVNGVPIRTQEGISVGSARADILAAQGWDVADQNGDGVADYMGVASREIAGTESHSRPGSVGVEYLLIGLKGDTVEQILLPANDFTD